MKEEDIMHENGDYWVLKEKTSYTVLWNLTCYAVEDSKYDRTEDGLSIAIARCNYLAGRKK